MEVNFKKSSWHSKFYRTAYNHPCLSFSEIKLPTNFCSYWRAIIFALICLPLTWWTYMFSDTRKNPHSEKLGDSGLFLFIFSVLEFCGVAVSSAIFGRSNETGVSPTWVDYVFGIPILIAIVFGAFYLMVGICSLFSWIFKKKEKNEYVDKQPGIVITYLKAKKAKICPHINWTE